MVNGRGYYVKVLNGREVVKKSPAFYGTEVSRTPYGEYNYLGEKDYRRINAWAYKNIPREIGYSGLVVDAHGNEDYMSYRVQYYKGNNLALILDKQINDYRTETYIVLKDGKVIKPSYEIRYSPPAKKYEKTYYVEPYIYYPYQYHGPKLSKFSLKAPNIKEARRKIAQKLLKNHWDYNVVYFKIYYEGDLIGNIGSNGNSIIYEKPNNNRVWELNPKTGSLRKIND